MARTVKTASGRTLDPADVDSLARRLEQGVAIEGWKPRVGRPALDPDADAHAPRIAVRVPEELRLRAAERAAREGRSVSALVRDLLKAYVDSD